MGSQLAGARETAAVLAKEKEELQERLEAAEVRDCGEGVGDACVLVDKEGSGELGVECGFMGISEAAVPGEWLY